MREDPNNSDLQIIMLTSMGMKGDSGRCKDIGIGGYLVKPVKQSELLDGIMLAMDRPEVETGPLITRHTIQEARRRLRVLVAEDNAVNQKLAVRLLARLELEPDIANNGLECLKALDARDYDLVFMDVQMPEMDGLEATRRIRASRGDGGGPYIIAMTANAMDGDREMCLDAGMDDYVSKPIRTQRLFDTLRSVLQDRRR